MNTAQKGFALLESMIVVTIAALLMAIAVPSFSDQMARRRLEGVAVELSSDLQYARSEAISKNRTVQLSADANGRFYSVNYVTLTGTPVSPALKVHTLPSGITALASAGSGVQFDPLRGMTTNTADFTVASTQTNMSLLASTSPVGRVRLCSPAGSFAGFATC